MNYRTTIISQIYWTADPRRLKYSLPFRNGISKISLNFYCSLYSKFRCRVNNKQTLFNPFIYSVYSRFSPGVVVNNIDTVLITWLLVLICAQDCIRNPYLIAKLIEVLFVINASVQVRKLRKAEKRSLEWKVILITGKNRKLARRSNGSSAVESLTRAEPDEVLHQRRNNRLFVRILRQILHSLSHFFDSEIHVGKSGASKIDNPWKFKRQTIR